MSSITASSSFSANYYQRIGTFHHQSYTTHQSRLSQQLPPPQHFQKRWFASDGESKDNKTESTEKEKSNDDNEKEEKKKEDDNKVEEKKDDKKQETIEKDDKKADDGDKNKPSKDAEKEKPDEAKKEEKPKWEDKPKTEEKPKKEEKTKKEESSFSDADKAGKTKDDKGGDAAADSPAAKDDTDEEVPNYQNPLHHKHPEKLKQFEEDFKEGEEIPYQELPPFEDPQNPDKVLASQEVYDLADEIVNLSMIEMNELVNKIADHFNFEKPPFTGSDGSGGGDDDGGEDGEGGGEAAEAVEEKTAFDLKLVSYDDKAKIKVIKEVRAIAGLGLKEAKEAVEGAPKVVMKDIGKEAAEEMKKKLEDVGATVEIV